MAKKKSVKRKKVSVRKDKGIGVDFHSWTFFLFVLFILVTVLILVAQQLGMRFL